MQINDILIPVGIFVGLGLLAGLLLSIFSKIFAVKTDERIENVRNVLPGLNCGVCGYSGCDGYAKAIVEDGAPTNKCVPGGDGGAKKISEILGTAFEDVTEQVAYVSCNGKVPNVTADSYIYQGEQSCAACNMYYQGKGTCDYGCIGLGDCVKQCNYGAISIVDEVAVIDTSKCKGCTMCVAACPKHLIHVKDATKKVTVSCSSCNTGKTTMHKCANGCIGCKKCERVCPNGAITVTNNVASIDYSKCTSCMECVNNCPKGCIEVL